MVTQQSVPIAGAIPRIERQESHHRFLWAVRPPIVMVGLTHAARIAMYDDDFFPPETSLIITSTISDNQLVDFSFEDELRLYRHLQPRWVIPFDFPVYGDMEPNRKREHTQQVAQGAADMQTIFSTLPESAIDHICDVKDLPQSLVAGSQSTTVIPLIKGTTPRTFGFHL